jgi:NAD(P)-dependent dehydrogenase (short-subunit alcohol dehydrogenase family)
LSAGAPDHEEEKRMLMKDRVAIVTGGARGIGYAIAQRLHEQGAGVVLVDSGVAVDGRAPDPAAVDEAAARLATRCVPLALDIGRPGAGRAIVAAALENFGVIDIVINNAAILRDAFIFKADRDNWDAVIGTNLSGAFELLAAATPVMREQAKGGRTPGAVVNIVSSAGIYGNFGQSAYAAAKAGLIGLTRVVALDLARSGIACNAVAPFAATRVTEMIRPADAAQAAYKEHALKIPASHAANLVAYLASPLAAQISGQLFGVRGREVFLFAQARPAATFVAAPEFDAAGFGVLLNETLGPHFTPLATDLEAFGGAPVL